MEKGQDVHPILYYHREAKQQVTTKDGRFSSNEKKKKKNEHTKRRGKVTSAKASYRFRTRCFRVSFPHCQGTKTSLFNPNICIASMPCV